MSDENAAETTKHIEKDLGTASSAAVSTVSPPTKGARTTLSQSPWAEELTRVCREFPREIKRPKRVVPKGLGNAFRLHVHMNKWQGILIRPECVLLTEGHVVDHAFDLLSSLLVPMRNIGLNPYVAIDNWARIVVRSPSGCEIHPVPLRPGEKVVIARNRIVAAHDDIRFVSSCGDKYVVVTCEKPCTMWMAFLGGQEIVSLDKSAPMVDPSHVVVRKDSAVFSEGRWTGKGMLHVETHDHKWLSGVVQQHSVFPFCPAQFGSRPLGTLDPDPVDTLTLG